MNEVQIRSCVCDSSDLSPAVLDVHDPLACRFITKMRCCSVPASLTTIFTGTDPRYLEPHTEGTYRAAHTAVMGR